MKTCHSCIQCITQHNSNAVQVINNITQGKSLKIRNDVFITKMCEGMSGSCELNGEVGTIVRETIVT